MVIVGGPALVTAVAPLMSELSPREPLEIGALLYVLAVAGAAAAGSVWGGLLAAGLAFVGQIWAFTEPMWSFDGFRFRDLVVLGVFLVVALMIAQLIARQRAAQRYAEIAHQRMSFLAEATHALTGTLDFHEALSRVARLAIPRLADLCTVEVLDEDDLVHPLVVASGDHIDAALADNLLHMRPVTPGGTTGSPAVMARDTAVLYARLDEEALASLAWDTSHHALLRGLRLGSAMVVPVTTLEGTRATITFAFTGGRRRYTDEDVALAEDLGRRAANVLDAVALFEERARTAQVLQRSLLPPELPVVPGLEIVARFYPSSDSELIGGDFYDVFQVGEDAWAFVVGDVCGKGVEAAALTGLARHTIRAAALRRAVPSRVLRALNDALLRGDGDRFCTAVFGLVQLGPPVRLVVSSGGHPLPLRLDAKTGEAQRIGRHGMLLGVLPGPDLVDFEVELGPQDTVVLYTDGILDERIDDPEGPLLDTIAECGGVSAAACADALDRLLPTGLPADDTALVVVKVDARTPGGFNTPGRIARLDEEPMQTSTSG